MSGKGACAGGPAGVRASRPLEREARAQVGSRFLRVKLPVPAGGRRPRMRLLGWRFSRGCHRSQKKCLTEMFEHLSIRVSRVVPLPE